MNACSDRKPRSFDAFLTCSRNSLLGNSRLRSVLGFAIDFLPFRLSKCRETWKKMRWHICATFRAKVATSLYFPIRVSQYVCPSLIIRLHSMHAAPTPGEECRLPPTFADFRSTAG